MAMKSLKKMNPQAFNPTRWWQLDPLEKLVRWYDWGNY
jgi:hypothetical protein